MNEKPNTADENEIASLRNHNTELLADLKKSKAKVKELQDQLEAASTERDAARSELSALKLDRPVREMLERVSLDPDLFALKFGQEYQFRMGEDGIEIHDADGNIPTITPEGEKHEREATFTADDIRALCNASPHTESYDRILTGSLATGSGAAGSRSAHPMPRQDTPTTTPARPQFGLS